VTSLQPAAAMQRSRRSCPLGVSMLPHDVREMRCTRSVESRRGSDRSAHGREGPITLKSADPESRLMSNAQTNASRVRAGGDMECVSAGHDVTTETGQCKCEAHTRLGRHVELARSTEPRARNSHSGDECLGDQRSDAITSFRIDRRSGALTFTGLYTPVGSPAHIVFLS